MAQALAGARSARLSPGGAAGKMALSVTAPPAIPPLTAPRASRAGAATGRTMRPEGMHPMLRPVRMVAPLVIALATFCVPPAAPAAEAPPVGDWTGRMAGLRIVIHIERDSTGATRATLSSPDQGAMGLPVDAVAVRGDSLVIEMRALRAGYVARMLEGGDSLSGTWSQGPAALPLGMRRGGAASGPRRPQLPRPPFPYLEEHVTVPNPSAPGVSLAGTLTLPPGKGPFPAVVLITGSGQQDRDETLFGHKPFLVLADFLTRRGFAVLRADDRGVGGSTGPVASATSLDFAGDIAALVDHLARDARIDRRHIALVGHSEGGLIAPMVAVRDPRVSAIVMLSGPGLPGDSLLLLQGEAIRRASGIDSATASRQTALQRRLFAIVRAEPDSARAAARIVAEFESATAGMTDAERGVQDAASLARASIRSLLLPWMRYFLACDPRPTLTRVRCPVLALGGSHDLQVPPGANLPEIARALKAGGNRDVTTREMPDLNHLFQTSRTGLMDEYGRLEETMAPVALETIATWLEDRSR
jgi:pimeloyl-ACP methyl ester carboxylesterase